MFESFDFKNYFEDETRRAYLVKVADDVAGFVLLNQVTIEKSSTWNMGEFFILGRYQGVGVGRKAAEAIWRLHPGRWEVLVIPENKSALVFWEKAIAKFAGDHFTKATVRVDFDKEQPKRVLFTFDAGTAGAADCSNED